MFILEDVYCQCTHELNLYCIFEYINRSRLKKNVIDPDISETFLSYQALCCSFYSAHEM